MIQESTYNSNLEKVENVKRPLKKGEVFLVPCIVQIDGKEIDFDLNKTNGTIYKYRQVIEINPVILHLHSDKENGQQEPHYHLDYRFIKLLNPSENDTYGLHHAKITHTLHRFGTKHRVGKIDGDLRYFALPVINESFMGITEPRHIAKSKLKNKCIKNGRCPHRGMDLSQSPPDENGVVTCPLHGLKFNHKTKQLVENVK